MRKPGLWQVKTSIDNDTARAQTVKQCIDAATDQMLQSSAGPFASSACLERTVRRSENSMAIDSACKVGGKQAAAHAVVVGSFDSAYTMTVTSHGEDVPTSTMTMVATWLGPCAADQRPGDVIMSNGVKINVPEMQKRSLSPGIGLSSK